MHISLDIYSPVQQIQNDLFTFKGIQLYIKRDDLIHPVISGNKWRKLKYVLQQAQAKNKNHLVTFGGAYSNHLLATAAAAAKFGFKATGIIRGEKVENDTLFLCKLHGMELIFTDREIYRDKPALFNKLFADDEQAFFIDEGGASPEGAKGCSELVNELTDTYHHIFCACGTGTTAAGIINGITKNNLPTQFNAIPVFKNGGFIKDEIDRFLTATANYALHLDYHFGGYAKTTPQLISFVKQFTVETGILIEPIYTGKMLYAIYDLAAKDHFAPGTKILAIHSGGIWGLLGMKDKFI
ncbi:1-aminocyclopropane-1-carboxylate deaminase/D-cysteine desulfhydrase [Mucilaginibacter phyllosphaerae]|uniref:1-aminocyclopropane-1-carboxylate deaminase n=1 Tax=Mucilaginibacter phyllosphaerae TaxID=1812349 RepID=A0A4Y8AKV2_9SPHI|nr:pyridoxal-phosphate dependent enzyme [Mucilaginibacter phyllosphaerae]MBB3967824.1 1-aminocyclopropane-1-carboxylate deaminase [Mucilaginibacter phyllosphaerae]TEW69131.1 pyridoxal-phosphate dependent enzyme [Mucilaginibacter phyllosphaerae]GGH03056.1 1-aminocyclopropane-1-carboxylate deaminase [Mucilaginibacter phyllosphaerae]